MSDFYKNERDAFRYKNRNRGSDKVSLFNKYSNGWSHDKFLSKVHRAGYQTNESREGRKLDVSGHMARFRPFSA